jgi:NADH dehydrogenase
MGDARDSNSAHIVVDGATGYLGTHLTCMLLSQGFSVACLVHPGANRAEAEALRKLGAQVFIGSLSEADEDSPVVTRAFKGAFAAVHLVGSVAPRKGQKLLEMHAGQSHWFVYHAQRSDVQRLVAVTTLGGTADANTNYQRTKWAGEQIIANSGLAYTILRPSLIVGRTVGHRDSKLVRRYLDMIERKLVVPVIAGGRNKVQPIFVEDVVQAICRCIFPGPWQREATKKVLELGGPEVVQMRQLVRMLMEATGRRKLMVGIPAPLAFLSAFYCQAFQEVPTVSVDQVKLSLSDNVCSQNALASILGIEPTPLRKALDTYARRAPDPIATGAKS